MIEDLDMIHYEILQELQGRDKPQGEKAKIALRYRGFESRSLRHFLELS